MKSFTVIAALASLVAAAPQGVTEKLAPVGEATPAGCQTSYSGKFELQVLDIASKTKLHKRDSTPLEITLADGVLTDAQGRTGYIAANNQFQFDAPAQTGAIYTAGWSVCANNSIALGNSAIFYQCLSGTFYNLYDENDAAQCSPVYLNALGSSSTAGATAQADGQITAGQAATVICQIGDGQIQQNTCITTPIAAVTQISDGQIQAPTGVTVTQISDGQIQAGTSTATPSTATPTGATITQISDGQIQAPTGAVVSQISDGQIQAPTNGTTVTSPTVTASSASSSTSASSYSGAAAAPTMRSELFGLAAGILALVAL